MAGLGSLFGRRSGPPCGVLLVSAGGLGDTVLFSLVLPRFMKLAQNGESVTVLLRRDAAKTAFVFPPPVRVEIVDFGRLRKSLTYRNQVFRDLRKANFRLVVSTDFLRHPELDEALVRACRAPEAVAMEPRSWPKHDKRLKRNRLLYDVLFDSGPVHLDKVLRWTAFADWLTRETEAPPLVRLDAGHLAPAAAPEPPTVLVQPFSAVPGKQSPPALYRSLFETLPADHRVIVAGAPGDLEKNPKFQALLDPPRVVFDASTFEALVPTLRAARLVVSVDTALMHLAVALGAPTLCLASAAYVGEIVPYAPEITPPNVRFLYQPMDCQGCLGSCTLPAEDGMFPCVAALDAERAAEAAHQLLGGGRP